MAPGVDLEAGMTCGGRDVKGIAVRASSQELGEVNDIYIIVINWQLGVDRDISNSRLQRRMRRFVG